MDEKLEAGKLKHKRYMLYLQLTVLAFSVLFTSYIFNKIPPEFPLEVMILVSGVFLVGIICILLGFDLFFKSLERKLGWAELKDEEKGFWEEIREFSYKKDKGKKEQKPNKSPLHQ